MGHHRKYLVALFTALCVFMAQAGVAAADQRQFCVVCTEPAQTYVCEVRTPNTTPGDKGMRLFCIIRTSKDGGHRSCKVDDRDISQCAGPVKAYTFEAPKLSPEARSAIQRYRGRSSTPETQTNVPAQKGGEPKTLIDLTRRAARNSKEKLKDSGEVVGNTADKTKGVVGKATRGVGKGVTKAAGSIGKATKKTGSAVGHAAKSAYDCIKSLFKDCSSSKESNQ